VHSIAFSETNKRSRFFTRNFSRTCVSHCILSTTTLSITAASFEKVFVRNWVANITRMQRHSSPDEYLLAEEENQDLATWREIAWGRLKKKKLGDSLRPAIVSLPTKYREVLFLRDVRNLDTAETSWILNITAALSRAVFQGIIPVNSILDGEPCALRNPESFGPNVMRASDALQHVRETRWHHLRRTSLLRVQQECNV
jgi:hypothetical protein